MKKIAVLGTGNIAQTVAVDLKSNGHEVRLFAPDYLISRIQKIVDTHEIECVGVFEAKEKIDVVTSDIDKAVKGADYIILCVPGNRHEEYARILKGHTTAQQNLLSHPLAQGELSLARSVCLSGTWHPLHFFLLLPEKNTMIR